jgi:hypothetical protein
MKLNEIGNGEKSYGRVKDCDDNGEKLYEYEITDE